MLNIRHVCVFIMLFLLSACVPPYMVNIYHPENRFGGYSDMALAPDIYKVYFQGNRHTPSELVQNYLLRRCAEITQEKGYRYFIILTGNTHVNRGYFSTPTTVNSSGYENFTGNSMPYGFNGSAYGNRFTTINPGMTAEIDTYSTMVIVKLLKNNKQFPMAFKADSILNSMGGY